MEQKKGILVVSFGTSHLDTLERTITAVEQYIAAQFPEYRVYRASVSYTHLDVYKRQEYDLVCLQRAEAKVVISEKHRWASQDSVTYADMKEADMLQFQKGSYKADKNNFYGEVKCRKICLLYTSRCV